SMINYLYFFAPIPRIRLAIKLYSRYKILTGYKRMGYVRNNASKRLAKKRSRMSDNDSSFLVRIARLLKVSFASRAYNGSNAGSARKTMLRSSMAFVTKQKRAISFIRSLAMPDP